MYRYSGRLILDSTSGNRLTGPGLFSLDIEALTYSKPCQPRVTFNNFIQNEEYQILSGRENSWQLPGRVW